MSLTIYRVCQPIIIREENIIDVKSVILICNFSYSLSYFAVKFVERAGENAVAFVEEAFSAKLLLLCNKETGEVFIPDDYSEVRRVEIKQQFTAYLLSNIQFKDMKFMRLKGDTLIE